ncbi:sensor histidine kinase [Microbacterium sp. NPDC057650]|uniref:sensor histidine kinase n=1 Tax=unclassified Microbacterium TaxID=2609290 RepID=UPI0036735B5D
MSVEQPPVHQQRNVLRMWSSTPFGRAERLTLLGIVAAGVTISLVFVVVATPEDLASSVFQLVLTAAFALFVWSPLFAAVGLLALTCASFAVDNESAALVALAVAAGCVVRTGTRPLLVLFIGGFLLSSAAAATYAVPALTLANFAATLLVAAVSGAVGYLLTLATAREQRLQDRLHAKEQAEIDATLAERQRIADELHDVIAHDLTVIAMYSRVLDQPIDEEMRAQSQQTIRDAAHKALGDLRRVVEQTGGPALLAEPARESLVDALENARAELHGVGDALNVDGDPADPRIPRVIDAALARIMRESITNVLKHGGRGAVDVAISIQQDAVTMSVRSPMTTRARRAEIPSGGYGIVRMTARASQLGGELTAGRVGDAWAVAARFPLG